MVSVKGKSKGIIWITVYTLRQRLENKVLVKGNVNE